jgi:hypothetical protein
MIKISQILEGKNGQVGKKDPRSLLGKFLVTVVALFETSNLTMPHTETMMVKVFEKV